MQSQLFVLDHLRSCLLVYEFLFHYTFLRMLMGGTDISSHVDYLEFQSDFEKLDEKYRLLNLVIGEIDRASGWNKLMLYKKLPKPKELRENLKKLDELTIKWAEMLRELVAEDKIEFDEGGEG